MTNQNSDYFLSGDYGLIALEQDDFWVYVSRLAPDIEGAKFSLAGQASEHFNIEPDSGVVTFNQTATANIGDSFQLEIIAQTDNITAIKDVEIKVLAEGIERAIFTYEEKISGTPYTGFLGTIDKQVINSITWGGRWITDVGKSTTLYYSFAEGADPFEIVHGPSNWTNAEKDEVRRAIQVYADLINIDFVEVDFDDNKLEFDDDYSLVDTSEIANFWLWKSQLNFLEDGVLGYSDVPSYSYGQPLYLELNYETDDFVSQNIGLGTEAYDTILHEFGHMLGLAHPFDGGSAEDASVLSWRWDSNFYTIMSYTGAISSEPSLNDITALRNIYGDRDTSDLSDNHYLVLENMSNTNRRVWDYAGSNTIDLSGAVLASMQETNKPNFIYENYNQLIVTFQDSIYNPSFQAEGNFDRLIATDAADKLIVGTQNVGSKLQEIYLRAGNDTVYASNAGSLNIDLGDGVDRFIFEPFQTYINSIFDVKVDGSQGADNFLINFDGLYFGDNQQFNSIYDTIDLEKIFNLSIDGGEDEDTLQLKSSLYGGNVDLSVGIGEISNVRFFIEGIERIIATDSADEIIGGANPIEISGRDGADLLSGGSADDALYGGRGDDTLYGGPGDDLLVGNQGADTLVGGDGNDTLYVDNLDTFDAGNGFDWVVFESPAIVNNLEKTFSFDTTFDADKNDYVSNGVLQDFGTFEVGVFEGSGGRLYGDNSSEVYNLSTTSYLEFFGNAGDDQHINRSNNYAGVEFHGGEGNDTLDLQFWIDSRINFVEADGEGEDTIIVGGFNAYGLDIHLPENVENFYSTEAKTSNNSYLHNIYGNSSDNKILAPARSSVFGGVGADVLVLKYGVSFADGGEDDDIILISGSADGSTADGGSGDDIIFIEEDCGSIEIIDSQGDDIYIYGDYVWNSSFKLTKSFDQYSFIEYQDRFFICTDDELNLISCPDDILIVDPLTSKYKADLGWQAPDVTQLDKILGSGFLNIPLGHPRNLVLYKAQSNLNDALESNQFFNLHRNYFDESYTSDPALLGLNDWFSGFDNDGELKGSLDLFESVSSNRKSDILLISSDVEGFGVFNVPTAITTYPENWNDFITPSAETIMPIKVGEQFNFFLADVFLGDLLSSGYLFTASGSSDELYFGNNDAYNFNVSGLPSGTKFDADTGYLSGIIEDAGLFNLSLELSSYNSSFDRVISLFAYDENETFSGNNLKYDVVQLGRDLFEGVKWVGNNDRLELDRIFDFELAHVGLASGPNDDQGSFAGDYTSSYKIFEDITYFSDDLSEGVYNFFGLTNEGLTGKKFSSSINLIIPSSEHASFEVQFSNTNDSPIDRNSSFELQLPEIDGVLPHHARFMDAAKVEDDLYSVTGVLDKNTGVVAFDGWYPHDYFVTDEIIIYALYGDQSLIGSSSIDFESSPFLKVNELSIRQGHVVQHEVQLGNIDKGETYKFSLDGDIPDGITFNSDTNILTLDVENERDDEYYEYLKFKIEQISEQGVEAVHVDFRLKITDNNKPNITTSSSIITNEDANSANIPFSGSDADLIDKLTFSFSNPQKGSIANNNDGTYTYIPDSDAYGSDSFIITVNDGAEEVSQTVNVTIIAENDAPVLNTTSNISVNEDNSSAAVPFSAADVDGDVLSFVFTDPTKGQIINIENGTYVYMPDADANGEDSFTITVSDGDLDVSQTVNVIINSSNDVPVLTTASSISVNQNTASKDILFSATDVDGDVLTFLFGEPTKGIITDNKNGTYTYTPHENQVGSDSFTITVGDQTDIVTEVVNVTIVPDLRVFNKSTSQQITKGTVFYKSSDGDISSKDLSNFSPTNTIITADYDLDTSGAVQISDVISQLRHIVGLNPLSGIAMGAADNDGDGDIAISDVISSLRQIVGLELAPKAKLITELGETRFMYDHNITELYIVAPGDADLSWTALDLI